MPEKIVLTKEHKTFLNDLRESGVINMYGAGPYIREEFGVTKQESHAILSAWMESFGK